MSLRIFQLAAIGFLACCLAGCGGGPTSGPKQSTVMVGDRMVNSFLDVPGELKQEGDSAVVTIGAVKVQIEKERVVIDGNDSGPIPATARRIDVTVVDNMLTVNADEAPVCAKSIKAKETK